MKYYDKEEKDFIQSFEKSKWIHLKVDKSKYQELAKENLKKTERINIRLSAKDLKDVKRRAAIEGMPYQTLISSLIHKFANGGI